MRTENLSTNNMPAKEAGVVFSTATDGTMQKGVLAQNLMVELMGVVPVLGAKKVVVGFSGTGAYCDKNLNYVNIPSLPPARIIPLQIAREIRGFAAHEAAHIAFTDPQVDIVDDNGAHNPLLFSIWNSLEDYMIEMYWLALYPGARKNFAATEIRCCRGYMETYTKDPDVARDMRRVGPVALTWMRAMHFNLGTQVSRDCFSTLNSEFQQRVMGWFNDSLDVETTQDCLDLAKIIYNDIVTDPFDPLNMPQNAQNSGQGQGQGQSQGQGQGQGKAAKGASSGAPQKVTQPYSGPAPLPNSANLDQVLQGDNLATNEMVSTSVVSTPGSGPEGDALADDEGYEVSANCMKEIQGHTSAITMHLRRALKAAAKSRFKTGRQDGTIDSSRISIAAMGGLDFHKRKIKGEEIDTAVSILVDCSGSMSGAELQVCQQMSLALETAFSGTKIKHEILGFTTADDKDTDDAFKTMIAANEASNGDAIFQSIGLYEFRKFGQSHKSALRSLGNMTKVGLGGTPTSEGILLAHDRLSRRPEKRHVMFVLTDGASSDNQAVQNAVSALQACNVTVIGVGICSDHVKNEFDQHVVINEISDLPAVMMSKITSILLGDKGLKAISGASAKKKRDRHVA